MLNVMYDLNECKSRVQKMDVDDAKKGQLSIILDKTRLQFSMDPFVGTDICTFHACVDMLCEASQVCQARTLLR